MSLASYHCSTPQYKLRKETTCVSSITFQFFLVGEMSLALISTPTFGWCLSLDDSPIYPKMAVRIYFTGLPFTWQFFGMTSVIKLFFYMVLCHGSFSLKFKLQGKPVAKPIVAVKL